MSKALVVSLKPVSTVRRIANAIVRKNVDVAVAAGAAALLWSTKASAALDLAGVILNTSDVEDIMMLVIPALGALWGFRKIVKTMNRS